ncbi:pyridoxal-phosphate dependent enzyme [Nocardioides aurantiacus]|uniref:D-cysteine desulfhydrase n=1 Tax=Nocardioides aurantiacus TaxID=86796 RepID=A0A3N2CQR7_9ACTN|nr:pyridoxal-phosphate dependent enzyme [Nocardioides aurantiacus]ROR89746.1 D-cysteine desulfhydrase [Nocardioides aurantiacus]
MVERTVLGSYPTPVEPAPRLARALGLDETDLVVKRDDLLGLGGGGNKVRKLERTTAEALARGATTLVTTGAAQSNHARLTAAAGARLGLAVELVLAGEAPDAPPSGNLLLDHLLGARLHWAGAVDTPGLERRAEERVAELGDAAYLVPYGGSNAVGAQAYADAGRELLEQVPDAAHVVVAVGSGGTMAGLLAALGTDRVLGVDTGATSDPEVRVRRLAEALGADLTGGLRLRLDQVGEGYSTLPQPVRDALVLAARTEGVVLDPVYTGRALAGLVAAVAEGDVRRGERTVLLHTGGLPGLFGSAAAPAFAAGLGPA